jgi:hypothetical protein
MRPSAQPVNFSLCLLALMMFAPLACNSAGGQAAGSDLSGPPVLDPVHAGRLPRKCAAVTKPPSIAQAVVLAQCSMEGLDGTMGGGNLSLAQDIKIQMGTPRAFIYQSDAGLAEIDVGAKVTPLRGSFTQYFCTPANNMTPAGHNCMKRVEPDAVGFCWKTNFNDYKCAITFAGSPPFLAGYPAPTTY